MYFRQFALLALILCVLVRCGTAEQKAKTLEGKSRKTAAKSKSKPAVKYPFLRQLTILKDSLPPGCKIQTIPADTLLKLDIKNRSITTDPRAFIIGDSSLRKIIDAKSVEAMYFSVYKEKSDLGLNSWAFRNNDAAKDAFKKLSASYSNEPGRVKLWLVKNHVVWLWRDPQVSNTCFDRFSKHVQQVVEKARGNQKASATPKVSPSIVELREFDVLGQCFSFHAAGIVVENDGERMSKNTDLVYYDRTLYANHYSNDQAYYSGKGGILDLGKREIKSVKEAPLKSYAYSLGFKDLRPGHCYSVRAANKKEYGVIRVLSTQKRPPRLKFEWRFPIPVAKRGKASNDKKIASPKVTLKAGKQEDVDAALAILKRFLKLWEEDQLEKASLLAVKSERKRLLKDMRDRPIELKSIDSISIDKDKDGLGANVSITIIPRQGIWLHMVFQDGKWWIID